MRVNSHYLFHAYPVSDGIGEATGEDQLILDHAFFFHGMQGIPRSSRTVRICTTENLSLILTSFASRRSLAVQMPNPRSRLVNRGADAPHFHYRQTRQQVLGGLCWGTIPHAHPTQFFDVLGGLVRHFRQRLEPWIVASNATRYVSIDDQ